MCGWCRWGIGLTFVLFDAIWWPTHTATSSQVALHSVSPPSQSVAARRFHTGLIDLFAALALALCCVGVYGTIAYWVAERAREIGVRMALGATRGGIRLMVVGRATLFAAIGVACGLALSTVTNRLLATMLFDVRSFDPSTIAAASLLVLASSAAAAYLPARRASSLDPLTVIRGE